MFTGYNTCSLVFETCLKRSPVMQLTTIIYKKQTYLIYGKIKE